MAEISSADVMKLRARTGMQMMKCKAALIAAGGDMEKAVEELRKQNKDAQDKVSGREAAEGRIGVFIDPAKKVGAIVELRCETAPVAKNELFVKLANQVAKQVALKEPASPDALLAQPFIDDPKHTMQDHIGQLVAMMRENMKPARIARLTGTLGSYVHHDGSVGVLLEVEGDASDPQLLRDVSMHVTAKSPVAARREDIPAERIAKEREIARAQAAEQGKGKPANIVDKIAEGKVNAWFQENVLAEQKFVKDETKTVGELLKSKGLKLVRFIRYRVGEVNG